MARTAANGEQKAPAAGTGARESAIRRESSVVKRALKILGPGLVTGAADDDPSE